MKIIKRVLIVLAIVFITTSCAMKRVVKDVYCDQKAPDGSCTKWAKHPYDCTHNAYGDCTDSTR